MGCLFLPWRPLLLPPLKPRQSPATATDLATAALTEELAMFAHTEDMVATLGATGPTEAIMERGKLNPQLLPKLKRTLTMALTAMVDTDCLTEADPTFRKRNPSYRRSYGHSYGRSYGSYSRSYPVSRSYSRSYSSYEPSYSSYEPSYSTYYY